MIEEQIFKNKKESTEEFEVLYRVEYFETEAVAIKLGKKIIIKKDCEGAIYIAECLINNFKSNWFCFEVNGNKIQFILVNLKIELEKKIELK